MPMEIDRKQIKQQAREAMSLSNPSFWIVTLVYLVLTTGLSSLADFTTGTLAMFLSVALTLYCWVVGFSYRLWALWTARRLEPGLGSLMEGFSVAGRVVLLQLGLLVRTMGWTLLLSVPMALIIVSVTSVMTNMAAALVVYVVLLVALVIAIEIIILRYSLAPYVLADYPDYGPAVALAHSVRLTKGWIWELVKLHLSFAGWYILSSVLSVVGLAVGTALSADLSVLFALSPDQIFTQLSALEVTPLASLLSNLFALPVALYFTPYLEVTLAQFYDARIHLGDNMADPMGGMQMPPV